LDKIEGLQVYDMNIYHDDRGSLLHILNIKNHPEFIFGECYASETKYNIIKAWKRHEKISQNIVVISGQIKLVIYDNRIESSTYQNFLSFNLSRENYKLVHIPKNLWYGFKCTSKENAIIVNCIDMPYDSKEVESCNTENFHFKYDW